MLYLFFFTFFFSDNDDLNAHWSKEDKCCFQPVCCPTCVNNNPSEPVGYKVVCAWQTCRSVKEGEVGKDLIPDSDEA